MIVQKVLLVDDVELFLILEKSFFRRAELLLLTARNGIEAVEMALAEKPSVVFMDLFMPELDGDQACRKIKSHPDGKHIPVVMVTHGGREADLQRCRDAGCDDILLKPINSHQFLETARHFLHQATRAAARVEARLIVRYGQKLQRQLSDYAVNISTGGLFLETDNPLPLGTPLALEFPLPDRELPVQCNARVAWINPYDQPDRNQLPKGMGLQFVDLPMVDLQAIRDFVMQQCQSAVS